MKVITIIAFIILGGAAIFGIIPMQDGSPAPGLRNITAEGWFPHGGLPILMTMVAVNFAFSGRSLSALPPGRRKTRIRLFGRHPHHHRPADYFLYRHRICAGGADPDAAGGGGEKPLRAGV